MRSQDVPSSARVNPLSFARPPLLSTSGCASLRTMFARPITIIVGAGAGVEYDMPLGWKLAANIADDVRFRFEHYTNQPSKGDQELYYTNGVKV
jgi:hypothetical protein